jgi:chaperonin cofactor prefoldin
MKVVDQRLRKLLEVRTDSPAMLEALNAVASVHREGGAPLDSEGARRNLRSDIEHRGLDVINDFIARLAPVEERLLSFNSSVEELVASCDRATRRIEQSEADTASFLAQAEALARRRDEVDAQLAEVTEFLTKFELTDDEAAALAMGPVEEDGGDAFFRALTRVNAIRLQSLSLLTGRDQALGIELLDAATKQQVRRSVTGRAGEVRACRGCRQRVRPPATTRGPLPVLTRARARPPSCPHTPLRDAGSRAGPAVHVDGRAVPRRRRAGGG